MMLKNLLQMPDAFAPYSLDFEIFHSVAEMNPVRWDQLSAGRPFTSHRWYRYGEMVMADCEPTYLIVYQSNQPVARATFWRTANEPLSIQPAILRQGIQAVLNRWPLLICRSPLAGMSGLVLPGTPFRKTAQAALGAIAGQLLKQTGCSFVIFDYLFDEECIDWPKDFASMTVPDPGTVMELTWPNFEAWLQSGDKKDRQHYKRTLREAENLGIQVSRHTNLERLDVAEALSLIQGVAHRFGSAENPWARAMLEHFNMLENATFLSANIGNRLVGCGLILEDNGAQMNAILGLAEGVTYVYFMLLYESLKIAFDHHIHIVRLGSGAYDVKERLGFSRENNNHSVFSSQNLLFRTLSRLAA